MKLVTKYVSDDGVEHSTPERCHSYDGMFHAVQGSLSALPDVPDLESSQYYQHDRENCLQAKRQLFAIAKNEFHWCPEAFIYGADNTHPRSLVGRLIDDSGIRCLQRAWGRMCCIDWDTFREYQQPYFAAHPNEATECVNP